MQKKKILIGLITKFKVISFFFFFFIKKNIGKKQKKKNQNLDWAIAQPRQALAMPLLRTENAGKFPLAWQSRFALCAKHICNTECQT